MPPRSPAFQFYPRDWDTDIHVIPMTYEEEGVYWALCRLTWLHGSLPADLNELRRLLKGQPSMRQMTRWWDRIGRCFQERDGRLYQPRLEREREKQAAFSDRQRENGRKGGRPAQKPDESQTEPTGNPPVSFGLTQTEPKKSSAFASASASAPAGGSTPPSSLRPIVGKRDGMAEFEHPRFKVPTWWHLENVGGLAGGEARMMEFYRWLVARVERTNEDTVPRKEWLNRCFAEWLDATKPAAPSSVPDAAETRRFLAEARRRADS